MDEFDFVVVGAGSSGAPIVDRLTASGRHSVLLLEAGPDDDTNKWLSIPLGFTKTFLDPDVNWKFATEPEPELNGRRIYWPCGKVVGGSSAINGAIYARGFPSDYDRWRQMGNPGWSFDDCLPYFKRLEAYPGGASDIHGGDGPVRITQHEYHNEIGEAFLAACAEAGLPLLPDFDGREGMGAYHATVSGGRRNSTGRAYLAPARRRANCRVVTGALVERIEIADGRATGVAYRKDGQSVTARARHEVVISAGAVGSPRLLQLSGLGPAAVLGGLGIPVVRDLQGVGENLQDHLGIRSTYRTWWRLTVNDDVRMPHRRLSAAVEYMLLRTGPLTANPAFVGAFVRLAPHSDEPDTQLHFLPWSSDRIDRGMHRFSGFTILANQLRPESRGCVRITSPDPAATPAIVANYLSTDLDRKLTVSAVKFVRLLARTAALSQIITEELQPGVEAWGDDDFLDHVRKEGQSSYNAVGTCRMGGDAGAVVDARLRVHGIAGLRVADASIMPTLISGNTNAACMMIGERAADLILADAR
ncbi:GMC family oxidoreductase [Reyranella sp.]|uniref:GMC family oxidoreductase n=1 Tax=Reyranella sp. TaxID=1929291 RepID=UPI00272FC886|nr:GMC family oxidoreductase N-terminal domain-containing protein [Reyranella sp.]MDP2378850.1 GMC family oxidoreductase N-terminal domain-containing protein [Reyranella sp.]